jgi:hypothetical protein
MEMPIDIINKHLAKQPAGLTDAQLAMNIDLELQRKFVSIPYEEIVAVEIEDTSRTNIHTSLQAGSGPETIRANPDDNPAWLYNSAVHALAMWQHLSRLGEQKLRIEKRPEPGVYEAHLAGEDEDYFTVIVDEQRLMWVPQLPGGMLNMADDYDAGLAGNGSRWVLQRINLVDGTVSA